MYDTDGYYPIFCAKSADFTIEQDEIETTSINSGAMREYLPGIGNATLNVTGVTTLDNTDGRISNLYLMQQSVRQSIQQLKVLFTDESANINEATFNGMIKTTSISRDIPSYSQSSVSFRVSGNITFSTVTSSPAALVERSDYWTMSSGATSISGSSVVNSYTLSGATILGVWRSGIQYNVVTTTPSGRECKLSGSTLSFDTSIPSTGETVWVNFKV